MYPNIRNTNTTSRHSIQKKKHPYFPKGKWLFLDYVHFSLSVSLFIQFRISSYKLFICGCCLIQDTWKPSMRFLYQSLIVDFLLKASPYGAGNALSLWGIVNLLIYLWHWRFCQDSHASLACWLHATSQLVLRNLFYKVSGLPSVVSAECHIGVMEIDVQWLLMGSSPERQGVQTQTLPGNSAASSTHLS